MKRYNAVLVAPANMHSSLQIDPQSKHRGPDDQCFSLDASHALHMLQQHTAPAHVMLTHSTPFEQQLGANFDIQHQARGFTHTGS